MEPFRLKIGTVFSSLIRAFIPIYFQPFQAFHYGINGPFNLTCLIGIFDSQDKYTAVMTGEQPVKQGGPYIPYMRVSGGTGGESHPYALFTHSSL
jgi:hypothetical protein